MSAELQAALDAIEHALREPDVSDYCEAAKNAGWIFVIGERAIYWRKNDVIAPNPAFACRLEGIVVFNGGDGR
jgi:hypothetical protein